MHIEKYAVGDLRGGRSRSLNMRRERRKTRRTPSCMAKLKGEDTKWGAHFHVLQTSTTALPFAPAEY